MTDRQVNALAAFLADGTTWQTPGIVAELRRQRDHHDPWQLAAAMIRRASDPSQTTPQLQAFDYGQPVYCPTHPGAGIRTDGLCGACYADANGTIGPQPLRRRGVPPTPEQRAAMVAVFRSNPNLNPEACADAVFAADEAPAELDNRREETA